MAVPPARQGVRLVGLSGQPVSLSTHERAYLRVQWTDGNVDRQHDRHVGHAEWRFEVSVQQNVVATDGDTLTEDAAVHFLTPAEAWEIFDEAARYYLQMSGQEFIKAWEAGKFDDDPDRTAVVLVGMLRPVGR
jgi:hypothetical protein